MFIEVIEVEDHLGDVYDLNYNCIYKYTDCIHKGKYVIKIVTTSNETLFITEKFSNEEECLSFKKRFKSMLRGGI